MNEEVHVTPAPEHGTLSEGTLTALHLLARLCNEISRPVSREEWDEALEGQHMEGGAQKLRDLLDRGLAEEWRGAHRVTRTGLALLEAQGLEGLPHAPDTRQVSLPDDLPPLGYGDTLVTVVDDRFALVDAQPGDLLVFRSAEQLQPGDVCAIYNAGHLTGLERITPPIGVECGANVLIAHLRSVM